MSDRERKAMDAGYTVGLQHGREECGTPHDHRMSTPTPDELREYRRNTIRPLEFGPPHEPDTVAEEMLERVRAMADKYEAWAQTAEDQGAYALPPVYRRVAEDIRRALNPTEVDG